MIRYLRNNWQRSFQNSYVINTELSDFHMTVIVPRYISSNRGPKL